MAEEKKEKFWEDDEEEVFEELDPETEEDLPVEDFGLLSLW